MGRLGFFADGESGDPGAILQRVLEEHYWQADPTEIPSEISLQHELPEAEILTQWLQEKKGRKVSLAVPQRQSKAELIEMVERNAQYELERTQRFADRTVQSLVDLAEILDLPDLPRRIEGYDISHLQGSNAVASQVVFTDGVPAKQLYRHYKIKNPEIQIGHSDDFASLAEVISRRFRRYLAQAGEDPPLEMNAKTAKTAKPLLSSALDLPDLILIDGGKGQLSAVVAVLQEMNLLDQVRVVSLAKKREEIFLPGESQPLPTDPDQPGLHLLRSVRDEAHRFAVSFHRQQRMAQGRRSRLQDIPGLGFQRQKLLLAHFHSIDYIREASLEQLMAVSGIGQQVAQEIFTYFHP